MRGDECFKIGAGVEKDLASAPTLCRFENSIKQETIGRLNALLLDVFIEHYGNRPPKEIIIDFDGTDFFTHGEQEQSHFNTYYDHKCFMPLYAFCRDYLLGVLLRPSSVDGAHHAWGLFTTLYKRIRAKWPRTRIVFRGDGGFCKESMLRWCDKKEIPYIVGMAKNAILMRAASKAIEKAKKQYEADPRETVRVYAQFEYAAKSWKGKRTLVARVEYNHQGFFV